MARVLMVTSVLPRSPGDATPSFVLEQAKGLAEAGCEVAILAPHGPDARFHESISTDSKSSVTIFRFPYFWPFSLQKLCYEGGMLVNLRTRPWTKGLLPFFFLAQLFSLFWVTLRWKPDLLHSHSLLPQGLTTDLVARLFRKPHITTSHGNDVFGLPASGWAGRCKKRVLRRANAVTVNSSATAKAVSQLGCDPKKIHHIPAMPNAYPLKEDVKERIKNTAIGEAGPVVVFVGRILEQKGVGDLLAALEILIREFPHLRCLLVGDGQDRPTFAKQAEDSGLAQHTFWAGWVPREDVTSWMACGDVLVVPSRELASGWTEAQGLVIVEAMLAGLPVVASSVGGITDMVEDGKTGCLVPPAQPQALANALSKVFKNPALREQLAHNSKNRAESHFSPHVVTSRMMGLYRSENESFIR